MRPALPLVALLAAGCHAEPPAPLHPDLHPGRGRPVLRLLNLVDKARLDIAGGNLPAGADQPAVHLLDSGWQRSGQGQGSTWWHSAPVHLAQKRHSRQPPGLSVWSGAKELTFDARIISEAGLDDRWLLFQDSVFVTSTVDPATWPDPPRVVMAPATEREAAYNRTTSGQALPDFVTRSGTIGAVTRPCLYLPAPSSAELDLQLPAEGAELRYAVGLLSAGEEGAAADARLDVSVDGERLESTRQRSGEPWTDVTLDLSRFAGRSVTLRLSSDPLDSRTRDYLCVANPELRAAPPAKPDPVRVVVIGIDTLRADELGVNGYARDTSPHLDALAARSTVFDNAWAPAPRTRPSFRTATTGRWPRRAMGAPTLGSLVARAGLQTAGFVANVHLAPRLGFAEGYDLWHYDNGANAQQQVDGSIAWLDDHADEDSFLFLHIMDPHIFYLAPEPFRDRFTDPADRGDLPERYNRWMVQDWEAQGQLTEGEKRFMRGRYDGEVAFVDDQLGRFLDHLDSLPGRTLVLLHTDHGEEFWDHGGFEHNHSLYEELTHTLLWVALPGSAEAHGRRAAVAVSLADIAPTVLDALDVPAQDWPDMDGRSLWPLIDPDQLAAAPRMLAALEARPLHQGYIMFGHERWSVVARDEDRALHKYILHTDSGQEELYDLSTDPREQRDLAAEGFLDPWRRALGQATSWPVGAGWRVSLVEPREAFTLHFSEPIDRAGVIDPEAAVQRRANLEWGELPATLPDDVAQVSLSDDHHSVTITPGPKPSGTVYLLGPSAYADVQLVDEQSIRPLQAGRQPVAHGNIVLKPGTVIVPLETEAAALAAWHTGDADDGASAEQIEVLQALGYVGE